MKMEFIEYLESVGITEVLHERIESIQELFRKMCPDEIKDIFITEYTEEDGTREYERLCFFSEKYFMDARNFMTQYDLTINPIKEKIYYLNIKKQDYDFERATEKSRFAVHCLLDVAGVNVSIDMKSSKQNCDHLRDIIYKYLVPNLVE